MTRRISCSRIGGRANEPRRCAPGTAMAAALVASVAVLAIGGANSIAPIGAVLAQTPGTAGPVSLGDLFTGPDNLDLRPGAEKTFRDAVRRAQAAGGALAPGQCPKPTITVTVRKGDDLFQGAVAAAQGDILKALLGGDADKFHFVGNSAGATNNVEIDSSVADTGPPTITVTPPSGTKVKNGQRLTIRVTATEPPTGWQAGVKQIQIEDVDRHTNLAPWDNPAPAPRPCGNTGLTHTIERSYVVPPDVSVAHLKMTARDYHNPQNALLVEYPTADWYGTIKKTAKGGGHNHNIDINFEFVVEPDGSIKGSARARITTAPDQFSGCTTLWTYSPSEFDIPLSGRRDGENFEIALDPGTTTATITLAGPCAEGQPSNTIPGHLNPAVYPETKHRISARDGATNTVERTVGTLPWGVIMRATIEIRQARQ